MLTWYYSGAISRQSRAKQKLSRRGRAPSSRRDATSALDGFNSVKTSTSGASHSTTDTPVARNPHRKRLYHSRRQLP